MRRTAVFAVILVFLLTLTLSVSGATGAPQVDSHTTVSGDGSCQVSITVSLHLEQALEQLDFPIPANAYNISLNGSRVRTTRTSTARLVDLTSVLKHVTGDFSVNIQYSLDKVVQSTDLGPELQLPLLSGFAYPVDKLVFSVTLPGDVPAKPAFSSGYHQANIEKDLTVTYSGTTINGTSNVMLKDHETLMMTLPVSQTMFPQSANVAPDYTALVGAMPIFLVLALIYWLLFLRTLPPRVRSNPIPPEAYSAGQIGSVLSLQHPDLTMMVFSWAQLGYLQIQFTAPQRILLHKQMDMGNERSNFELRVFRALFGKRDTVDTSTMAYAMLCQKIARTSPNVQPLLHQRSGNPKLFRGLAAIAGAFSGIQLGTLLSIDAAVQWPMVTLLAILGLLCAWHIHPWADCLFSLDKRKLLRGMLLCAGWIVLSIIAGNVSAGITLVLTQLLAGLMAAYGGRRTETGKQVMEQTLGLRRYMLSVSPQDLQRICQNNPNYFHDLAPYALAMGIDNRFAKRFGTHSVPACPYLQTSGGSELSAYQWSERLRQAAKVMNARYHQISQERLLSRLQALFK